MKLPFVTLWPVYNLMHQSIPAVPIPPPPPPGKGGLFAHVASPGGGAFAILLRPRGLGVSVPQGAFSKDEFIGKDEAFVEG